MQNLPVSSHSPVLAFHWGQAAASSSSRSWGAMRSRSAASLSPTRFCRLLCTLQPKLGRLFSPISSPKSIRDLQWSVWVVKGCQLQPYGSHMPRSKTRHVSLFYCGPSSGICSDGVCGLRNHLERLAHLEMLSLRVISCCFCSNFAHYEALRELGFYFLPFICL